MTAAPKTSMTERKAGQSRLVYNKTTRTIDTVQTREPTATERLAELQALRAHRPDGLIVAPPQVFTVDTVRKWLAEVTAVGSPGDVEIAWHRIQDRMIKSQLVNEYERLRAVAGQRHYPLEQAALRERERAKGEWRQRSELAALRREIEADEKALAAKRQKLARLSA